MEKLVDVTSNWTMPVKILNAKGEEIIFQPNETKKVDEETAKKLGRHFSVEGIKKSKKKKEESAQ